MNNEKYKNWIISDIFSDLVLLKAESKIQSFNINCEEENLSVDADGNVNSELIVNVEFIPLITPKFIDMTFTITPSGATFI